MSFDPPIVSMLPRSSRSDQAGAVAIVASAGGIPALLELLENLPRDFSAPIFIAQHLPRGDSMLDCVISRLTGVAVEWARDGIEPLAGRVYLVPPGEMLHVDTAGCRLSPLAAHSSSWLICGDRLIESLARIYGARTVAIVLSGMLPTAIEGLRAVNRCGGFTMAQDQRSADFFAMPSAAIDFAKAQFITRPARMAQLLGIIAAQWAMQPQAA